MFLFDVWRLGPNPEPDPLDRELCGVNRKKAARERDFAALLSKLSALDRSRHKTG